MFVSTIVMVLLTPYILERLGDERYGIYLIIYPIMQYVVLMEMGLRGSVARFTSKYISANDTLSLNRIVSTTFVFCLLISLVVMTLSFLLGGFSTRFFNISEQYHLQTMHLVLALGFVTVISFLSYSFTGVIIGHNRYELQNAGMLIQTVGRAALVVILFSLGWVSLSSWAWAMIVSSVLGLIFWIWSSCYIQKGLRLRWQLVNKETVKELFGFGMWNMILQLSGFLVLSVNAVIIGKFLGTDKVPYYAIPFMLVTRLQSIVMGLTTTLRPHASSTLASGDKALLAKLLVVGTYVAAMITFPVGGVLLVMCKALFRVWLPVGYESSWVIYGVLMIAFFGSITQSASHAILIGGGRIRGLALVYLVATLASVGLGIAFVGYLGMGIVGAAIALVIPRFISNCLFQTWYASSQTGLRFIRYLSDSYTRPMLCSLPSVALGSLLVYLLPPGNLIYWVLEYILALTPFAVLALAGVLDWPMREKIVARLVGLIGLKAK